VTAVTVLTSTTMLTASDHPARALPRSAMNFRRLMGCLPPRPRMPHQA
jgi:hypothetical protein